MEDDVGELGVCEDWVSWWGESSAPSTVVGTVAELFLLAGVGRESAGEVEKSGTKLLLGVGPLLCSPCSSVEKKLRRSSFSVPFVLVAAPGGVHNPELDGEVAEGGMAGTATGDS